MRVTREQAAAHREQVLDAAGTLFRELRDLMPGPSPSARRRRAVATLAGLVGALILARAVDDPELSDEILKPRGQRSRTEKESVCVQAMSPGSPSFSC